MQETADDIRKREAKFVRMTETPVRRLILHLAVPTIISMMISAMYNMADAYFVGNLCTEAVAGVGVAFAYQALIQAVGFFFGAGSGTYLSRALGARNIEGARQVAATGFFSALIISSGIALLGLIFLKPLTVGLGATPDVVPYACDYMRYLLIATPFMVSQMSMNNQLRMQGNAYFAMIGIASGAILNVILDPIFIFVLDLGVSGASIATLVSQTASWCLLYWGTTREGNVHIEFRNFAPSRQMYREIATGGLPSLMRQSLGSISTICLNWAAAKYAMPGAEASTIAAFAVVSRVMLCAMSMIIGFGQGFQPVVGFNWGAGKYQRVRRAYFFTMNFCFTIILILSILGWLFAENIIAFFRSEDPELIRIGARVLRWQCSAFIFVSVTTPTNMLFQNIRRTGPATILACGRQGIFFYPALLILPYIWGLDGLMAVLAAADLGTFILAIPFCIGITRELIAKEKAAG